MRPLAKKASAFVLSLGGTALAGYAFQFIASRRLGPERYGIYTALMALIMAFARPLEALSPLVARTILENGRRDWKHDLRGFISLALAAGLVLGAALLIFALIWGKGYGLPFAAIFTGALTLVAWAFLYVFRGVLQGHYKDESYLINRPLELFGRLAGSSLLFTPFAGLTSAIAASLIGAAAGVAHIITVMKDQLAGWRALPASGYRIFERYLKIMLIWLAGGFFIGLDMILAKRLFPPAECGYYAIANLIGKGALVYAFALLPLIYPRLVRHRLSRESLRYLGMAAAYSAALFTGAFFFFLLWGETVIPFFFGEAFRPAAPLVPLYLAAVFPLSLHFAVINLGSAVGDWGECVFTWSALGVYFLVLWTSPARFPDYLLRIGIGQALFCAGGCAFLLVRNRYIPR
ncbi:MAG TPA: oligosaccharide flippase family protein [Candidatus Omnitrophota bacterium]|nr:oligosaccharide flippase family protein [Candidatus Omnitrophota bacterium]